jgi:subtilisin family serine protease
LAYYPERVLPGDYYWVIQGTSMSAPHVAGAIALLLQQNANMTPKEALEVLKRSAVHDSFTGTLPNKFWGWGKLNVMAAMQQTIADVEPGIAGQPYEYQLSQNYPNPFNAATTFSYSLANAEKIRIGIYNLQGQEIAVLVDGRQSAGPHQLAFDASQLASGLYFYRLHGSNAVLTRKMVLVK